MKVGVFRVGYVLLGLLTISAGLLSLGENDSTAQPKADSYGPSGTSALFRLMAEEGMNPMVDRSGRPKLNPGDVAVLYQIEEASVLTSDSPRSDFTDFFKKLRPQIREGASAVILPLKSDFKTEAESASKSADRVLGPNDSSGEMTFPVEAETDTYPEELLSGASIEAWTTPTRNLTVAETAVDGKGQVMYFCSGIFTTNRFIDRLSNAQIITSSIAGLRGPKGRVVFVEASFGNAETLGVLARIGPWAQSAWWQVLVLFAVILYTENRRFGLPDQVRSEQRGMRELFDAVADTQRRSRDYRGALGNYLRDAEARMRKALKLPREMSPMERARALPPDLNNALFHAQKLQNAPEVSKSAVLEAVLDVETQLNSVMMQRESTKRG